MIDHPHTEIGERLKRFRLTITESQKEFASAHGFGISTYSGWETGERRIPIEQAAKLEAKYGLSLDWLYLGRISALPHKLIIAMNL
jgi:transcriptional regulator with XRE-family HTH domain